MSKIEVNTVEPQCGTTLTVGKCTTSVAVPGNVVKSNALQASDGGNIVSQSGTDITLGASGDTINLASGASQSGFGRTGTVDWQTGSIKTALFTAVNGEGYFANTSGGAFTMNLPAGSAGAIVSVVDYTNTFQTYSLTVAPNGAEKIGGIAADSILSTEGQSVTFVYVDGTEGWKNIQDSTSNVIGNPNLVATGGCITTCGDDKIHKFTGPGTFNVSQISTTASHNTVSYLVVASGGGSGPLLGGGGAGGYREVKAACQSYSPASPLCGVGTPANHITVTASPYSIAVGAGGSNTPGEAPGNVSTFDSITSAGGGKGLDSYLCGAVPGAGGSGGGAGHQSGPGGNGNTPPVTPPQGSNGGGQPAPSAGNYAGSGGGGATEAGVAAPTAGTASTGGRGGAGTSTSILSTGVAVNYTGGAGGGGFTSPGVGGDASPCGTGGKGGNAPAVAGVDGTENTGGGGGGGGYPGGTGGIGGSGIVIIRYKYQ